MTTDQYAVFGNPISHSKSPILQQAFAQQTQQKMEYSAQQVDDFRTTAHTFFSKGGKGLNVTVPFKQEAFEFANHLSERAQRAKAVNTLSVMSDGLIYGDNTDGVGLVHDITVLLNWKIKGKKVLILGAGGAVRGVLQPIIAEQPKTIMLTNRTVSKAQVIAKDFSDIFSITACGFNEIKPEPFDLIINATSASLSGDLPPLPNEVIGSITTCYDMMYGKALTPFLVWAQKQGTKHISDGLGMLVSQGAESFFIWRGVKPDIKPVIALLREKL